MASNHIILQHLCFTGEGKSPALLEFVSGLNVLYGASETGKSFVLETLDFMLGGNTQLRDIPERIGYDRIFLGIKTSEGQDYTLVRSTSGGNFQLFEGLHKTLPLGLQPSVLGAKHSANNENNVSNFLLKKVNLQGKKIKKNAEGALRNFTFRDLSHLSIIDEERIQKRGSPIEVSEQVIHKTAEYSIFKLLLTGVDDSSFVASPIETTSAQVKNSKIELIDELIASFQDKLSESNDSELDLTEQLGKIENSISQEQAALSTLEREYRSLVTSKNNLRKKIDEGSGRRNEIEELKARFNLLKEHYESDLDRLAGIKEAGSLIAVLEVKSCPLCGAAPDHQHPGEESYGNLETIIAASNAESEKIIRLRNELLNTLEQLDREASLFDEAIPNLIKRESELNNRLEKISRELMGQRVQYTDLIDKRSEIRSVLSLIQQIKELQDRRSQLENPNLDEASAITQSTSNTIDLSTTVLDEFAQHVERVLKAWHFPDADRVQFDESSKDLIISGKKRGSRGKGMRSITHAAFIVSLLEYCVSKQLPHPGFLVIDSPLLAYREPEDLEDDLSGTDVQDKFYAFFNTWTNTQIIIIENITPPTEVSSLPSSVMFSKNPNYGRYGLFPLEN